MPFVALTTLAIGALVIGAVLSVLARQDPDDTWRDAARRFIEGALVIALVEIMIVGLFGLLALAVHPTSRGRRP